MNPGLPPRLKQAADTLLEGVPRKSLAARAQAISQNYREGKGSAVAVTGADDTLAYLIARLPATYAVAAAVLGQIHDAVPGFAPATLLDVGAGPATASWAAHETWPSLTQFVLTDSNPHFLDLARKLAPQPAEFLARNVLRDTLPPAELVIASFVLAEIVQRNAVVEKFLSATTNMLVLIEPGTPAGFERIRAARALLIEQGAHVIGPCTHANTCPMTAPDWCHFSQRLPRSRDHMQAKGANVPYEDERYAWIAVSRTHRSTFDGRARILAPPRESKPGTELKLCTPKGLETRFIAKRDRDAYVAVRKAGWGDVI